MQHSALAELPPLVDILRDNPGWLDEAVDTQEASRITDTPAPTLETLRVRGGGPAFVKLKKSVKYTRRSLFEWLAAGRRTSTSDAGPPAPDDDGADDMPALAEATA